MAAKKVATEKKVKLNEKQVAVIRNHEAAIADLRGRLDAYLISIRDANSFPEDFFPAEVQDDVLVFAQVKPQGPQEVK